jgi:PAS domain S-box-containing protein
MTSENAMLKNRVDGEVSELLEPIAQFRAGMFYQILFIIWAVVSLYAVLFYWLGSGVFWVMLAGALIISPVTYFLAKTNHLYFSRMMFIVSANFYIYATSLIAAHQSNSQAFYIPAVMLPLLFFDIKEKTQIIFSFSVPLFFWLVTVFCGYDYVPKEWIAADRLPLDLLRNVNFITALITATICVFLYTKTILRLKDILVSRVENESDRIRKNFLRQEYILEGAGLGTWDLWLNKDRASFDYRWCQMLGLSYEETEQNWAVWKSLIHPEDKLDSESQLNDYINGNSPFYENIHRMKHANGQWIWVLDRARISEYDLLGKPQRLAGTQVDINRHIDQELASKDIQKIANIGSWEFELESKKTKWSEQVYHIYCLPVGQPPEPDTLAKYLQNDERERWNEHFRKCALGQKFLESFEIFDANGSQKWVEINGEAVEDTDGVVKKMRGTIQDVTIRKKMEDEARAQKLYVDLFFKKAPFGFVFTSMDGQFLEMNDEFARITGYDINELNLVSSSVLTPDKYAEQEAEQLKILNSTGAYGPYQKEYRRKNGELVPVRLNGFIIEGRNKTKGIWSIVEDITEELKLKTEIDNKQQEISASRLQLSTIFNHAPMAVYECHVNNNWTMNFMSPHIEVITGFANTDFINDSVRTFTSIIHPEDVTKVEKSVAEAIANDRSFDMRYQIVTKNNEIKWVWERGALVAESGYLVGVIVDISQQVKHELQITKQTSELKNIMSQLEQAQKVARIGSWSLDLPSQKIQWSKQMYELFDEKVERGPPSLERHKSTIHSDDVLAWEAAIGKCVNSGDPYKIRFRSQFVDKIVWIEAIGYGLKNELGEVVQVSGTCQDITDIVTAEKNLAVERSKNLHNAKLVSLGEMSAGIAHEINNPLAVISGSITLIESYNNEPVKLKEKLQSIVRATQRIEKIVKGLRKFARSSDKKDFKDCNLSDLVAESLTLTESKCKKFSCDIRVEVPKDITIYCDDVEIEQVLVNLINNAVDAVKNLPDKWIVIAAKDDSYNTLLRIMDSGSGIDLSVEEKLFQPFFTTKAVGEGTGLGLSITKGILDEHKATIQLNRNFPNTCFDIRIPKRNVQKAI